MGRLADLLSAHYERSTYKSVAALARAAQEHTSLSESYLKQLFSGARDNPSYDKLAAIARVLNLSTAETNQLLEAAGLPELTRDEPDTADPLTRQVLDTFTRLRRSENVPAETVHAVVNGFTLLVEGARASAGATRSYATDETEAPAVSDTALLSLLPASGDLRPLPQQAPLEPGTGLVDDLLGEILSRSGDHPLDILFLFLTEAAQEDGWEIKRRIAETLPQLVELQPDASVKLAMQLREDYHPDYQADIRRRVVEAVPALHRYRPKEALTLLSFRDRDEIYTAMAIVEALHDLESSNQITAVTADRYFATVNPDDPVHAEVITYLRRLLQETRERPAQALLTMQAKRNAEEKLFKVSVVRAAPRLLDSHPHQVLRLLADFLKRDETGEPVEHKNVRRPVAKALPGIIALLPDASDELKTTARDLLEALAQDPDLHIRRAMGDALPRLAAASSRLLVSAIDILIKDPDPYVRQRTGRALPKLAEQDPDRAYTYYVSLLTTVA